MKLKALLLTTFVSSVAVAGTVGGGGGVVWQCTYGNQIITALADVAEVEVAFPNLLLSRVLQSGGVEFVGKALNAKYPGLGDAVNKRVTELKFKSTTNKLALLNDDGLPLEKTIWGLHCIKAQLAIQNFSKGEVVYNSFIYEAMSTADQILFKAHEALVSLQERQFGSTVSIRAELSAAVNDTDFLGTVVHDQHDGHDYWYRCAKGGSPCLPIATPTPGEPDLYLKEHPSEAETVKAGFPAKIDASNYSCERDGGWVCSQDDCSPNFGYTCSGKPGTRKLQCAGGCTFARLNGVEIDEAPDGMFYIPEDQIDKLDIPMREFP